MRTEVLEGKIKEWLREEGVKQTVKVTIQILPSLVVEIDDSAKEAEEILWRALKSMPIRRIRMENAVNNYQLTLESIRKSPRHEMLRLRNIGIKTLNEFEEALQKEGISCLWYR